VRCIVTGVLFSYFPIGWSLYIVFFDEARFVEGGATWPMFGASLIVTIAFAIGMTRYRLMELDKIITSGMGYALVSVLAGLMYYAVVFVGTLFYGQFISSSTLPAALTVSTAALLFVLALDAARNRIQAAVDRRFTRTKIQLDRTLEQMSKAVSQLVDRPALAQRLLGALSDTFGVSQGAIYLKHSEAETYQLAASIGLPPPAELAATTPLLEAMKAGLGIECPIAMEGNRTSAQQQIHDLGGEIAQPLLSEGEVLAVLILGAKETPYRAEDWSFLAAFAQITIVALESAAKHRTIEVLNQDLQAKVEKIAEQQRRILALQTQLHRQAVVEKPPRPEPPAEVDGAAGPNIGGIVGSSPVVRQLLSVVRKVAATDAVVLLRGESGTGKELLARAVHESSPRAGKPYVKVHCAALSANLLESELFGHVKGAFTGAHRDKVGRFELANGGTLFLDEIGDISLEVQTKLLRVLQEKTIERVGSSDTLSVDVRIIAATHQDLEALIRQGRFREDLFYRLNVFPIRVPALRERKEDIAELAVFFVKQSAERCKKNVTQIDDDSLVLLKAYDWPGNIRQLENMIERSVVIAERDTLTTHDLPGELFASQRDAYEVPMAPMEIAPLPSSSFRSERDRFEREQLERALAAAAGNKAEAARILGVARSTLVSRMKKLGIEG
jgi:transcriptional regulator with GAF, ATPase, and Fis domain